MIKSIVIKSLEKIAKEVLKKTSNILSSSVSDYGDVDDRHLSWFITYLMVNVSFPCVMA